MVTVADVRSRVATALAALTGWKESRMAPDSFPGDAGQWAHLAFAVHVPATSWDQQLDSSRGKRGTVGGLVRSEVRVRWTYRIVGDAQVATYAAALTAEADAIKAVTALANTGGFHVAIDQATRTGAGDGSWLLGEIVCTVLHQLPIQ